MGTMVASPIMDMIRENERLNGEMVAAIEDDPDDGVLDDYGKNVGDDGQPIIEPKAPPVKEPQAKEEPQKKEEAPPPEKKAEAKKEEAAGADGDGDEEEYISVSEYKKAQARINALMGEKAQMEAGVAATVEETPEEAAAAVAAFKYPTMPDDLAEELGLVKPESREKVQGYFNQVFGEMQRQMIRQSSATASSMAYRAVANMKVAERFYDKHPELNHPDAQNIVAAALNSALVEGEGKLNVDDLCDLAHTKIVETAGDMRKAQPKKKVNLQKGKSRGQGAGAGTTGRGAGTGQGKGTFSDNPTLRAKQEIASERAGLPGSKSGPFSHLFGGM